MKKILYILLLCLPTVLLAAGDSDSKVTFKFYGSSFDKDSIERGAHTFAQSCLACHSLKFMRFKRVADDLNWSEEKTRSNITAYSKNINDNWYKPIISPLDPNIAHAIFGIQVPDLSLIARSKGTDYLLTYLLSFYRDEAHAYGIGNAAFPGVSMPNVLQFFQGERKAIYNEKDQITGFEVISAGQLNKKEFYNKVSDLVNFLDYVAEPAKATRLKTGWWVILFTLLLATFAYFLKRNYWQDIK